MVKDKNSVANSVETAEVKLFTTTPVQRFTSELIPGAYSVFAAVRKDLQPALDRKPGADVIAPAEVGVPAEIMKRTDGLMMNPDL
jgi:hypothetical protein